MNTPHRADGRGILPPSPCLLGPQFPLTISLPSGLFPVGPSPVLYDLNCPTTGTEMWKARLAHMGRSWLSRHSWALGTWGTNFRPSLAAWHGDFRLVGTWELSGLPASAHRRCSKHLALSAPRTCSRPHQHLCDSFQGVFVEEVAEWARLNTEKEGREAFNHLRTRQSLRVTGVIPGY